MFLGDAYTHAPETFDEFYNQRRRWLPSTMANILDLLKDYKRTVKANDNISNFYIAYQVKFRLYINMVSLVSFPAFSRLFYLLEQFWAPDSFS